MPPDREPASETYLFGDSELAARRLQLLAEVFAPSTRAFLERLTLAAPKHIIDVGCGPGHTTRTIAEIFPQAAICGLDCSRQFIGLARAVTQDRALYFVADATSDLPGGPYDLVYCRYVLTHLPRPIETIALWSNRLSMGGRIAIEENEWIRSEQPAFVKYLGIVAEMLAAGGQKLYLGAELDKLRGVASLRKTSSDLALVAVNDRVAARMFWMNLRTWRGKPFVEQHYDTTEIDELEHELATLAAGDSRHSSITFGLRQLVFERMPTGVNWG